ncbi:MAG TPA: hypothetical protein V6C97_27280, partial [Oculatellaceae cyanobacterium]
MSSTARSKTTATKDAAASKVAKPVPTHKHSLTCSTISHSLKRSQKAPTSSSFSSLASKSTASSSASSTTRAIRRPVSAGRTGDSRLTPGSTQASSVKPSISKPGGLSASSSASTLKSTRTIVNAIAPSTASISVAAATESRASDSPATSTTTKVPYSYSRNPSNLSAPPKVNEKFEGLNLGIQQFITTLGPAAVEIPATGQAGKTTQTGGVRLTHVVPSVTSPPLSAPASLSPPPFQQAVISHSLSSPSLPPIQQQQQSSSANRAQVQVQTPGFAQQRPSSSLSQPLRPTFTVLQLFSCARFFRSILVALFFLCCFSPMSSAPMSSICPCLLAFHEPPCYPLTAE